MELYQLRAFLAVARIGNLTRAAEHLHLSQPAVSKQIRALEEELGVALFERTAAGTTLSKAGTALEVHAQRTLEHAAALHAAARALRGATGGTLRIGTIIDPESIRLGELLQRMLAAHPLVEIKLHHGVSGEIMERVRSGELDAGFYLGPISEPTLVSTQLATFHYRVIAPIEWGARVDRADWAALAVMPWVGTPLHSSQHRIVRDMFAAHGLTPNYAVEADQESSMLSLVRSGAGLCIMREQLALPARDAGELHVRPGPVWPCGLSLVRRRHAGGAAIEALMHEIRDVWALSTPA